MCAWGPSAAGILHLLQLASTVGEAAARARLHAAVLDALLPDGPASLAAEQLQQRLAAVLQQCSADQVQQLRDAVQGALAGCRGVKGTAAAAAAAAAASTAVQLYFQRLHAAVRSPVAHQPPVLALPAKEGSSASMLGDGGSDTAQLQSSLNATVKCLFVLGPFSSADVSTCLAEAGLLLFGLRQLASQSSTQTAGTDLLSESLRWLLAALVAAFSQLRMLAGDSPPDSQADAARQRGWQQHPAAAGVFWQEAHAALHDLLLSAAGRCAAVRSGALEAALAAPAATDTPLRLLRSLVAACSPQGACSMWIPGCQQGRGDVSAAAQADSGADAMQAPCMQVRLQALLSTLGLLDGMTAEYKRQRAEFKLRLAGESARQAGTTGPPHPPPQHCQGTSKAGRPLRPAAEWWLGDGQGRPGSDEDRRDSLGPSSARSAAQPAGAAAPPAEAAAHWAGGPAFDYMQGEDQAAKQEAAAQRFLDSLVAAADSPPACFLPLLERLASGRCAGEEGCPGAALPGCVQVRGAGRACARSLQHPRQATV